MFEFINDTFVRSGGQNAGFLSVEDSAKGLSIFFEELDEKMNILERKKGVGTINVFTNEWDAVLVIIVKVSICCSVNCIFIKSW